MYVPKNQQKGYRSKELAMIHIGKKQLGMDDTTYREMLQSVAGVSSSAKLTASGRRKVIDHMKSCGFYPVHKSAKKSGMHNQPPERKRLILGKIGAILADMDLSWSYADGIAKRMFSIDRVLWLNPADAHKVLISLIYHQKGEKWPKEEEFSRRINEQS